MWPVISNPVWILFSGAQGPPNTLTCSQHPSGYPPLIFPAAHTVLVLWSWSAGLPLQDNRERLESEWAGSVVSQRQQAETDRWHTGWHQCVEDRSRRSGQSFSCQCLRPPEDTQTKNNLYWFPPGFNTRPAARSETRLAVWSLVRFAANANPARLANMQSQRHEYNESYWRFSDTTEGVEAWQLRSVQHSRLPVTVALVTLWMIAFIVLVELGSTLCQLPSTHGADGAMSPSSGWNTQHTLRSFLRFAGTEKLLLAGRSDRVAGIWTVESGN